MNKEILKKVEDYLTKNPDIRFCQALYNLNINILNDAYDSRGMLTFKDTFNDTDEDVLKRIG